MDVSIVIVSWRVKDLLRCCLASVYQQTRDLEFEVFVVDNNSGDETNEMVARDFPDVHLIANRQNVGFARANNQAIARARGTFVLLLNPDTEVVGEAVGRAVRFMRARKDVGITGVKMFNPDGSLQQSVRRFPTFCSMALLMLKLHRLFPAARAMKTYLAGDFDYTRQQSVDQVMGAFFMVRAEVFKKIGLLDEKFFIWFEEVDFCRRARQAGFRTAYLPDSHIIHHFAQSFNQVASAKKQGMFNRSLLHYFKKHKSFLAYSGLLLLHPLSLSIAQLAALATFPRDQRRPYGV